MDNRMTDERAAPELLPCPFCGGPVMLEKAHQQRHEIFGLRQLWGVVCRNTTNFGGTCCMEQVPSASQEAAIGRWNRRAPAAAPAADGLPARPAVQFNGVNLYTVEQVLDAIAADRRARAGAESALKTAETRMDTGSAASAMLGIEHDHSEGGHVD